MHMEILTPHGIEAARWESYLRRLDPMLVDVHFTPDYARVQEKTGVIPILMVGGDKDRFIVQPFVIRKTDVAGETVVDLESPYGYGGPLAFGLPDPADAYPDFWCAVAEWASREGIVTERSVIHPFSAIHQTWIMRRMDHGAVAERKQIVYMHVTDGWRSRYRANRIASLKIASRAGGYVVDARPDAKNIERFASLYRRTMERAGAASRWYFSDDYFAAHFEHIPGARLFFGFVGNDLEVATIALRSKHTAHYHFSGSAMENRKAEAPAMLVDHLAEWAQRSGCSRLHLGGGATTSEDDSLLAFKASFSPYRAPVYVTQHVFARERYDALCLKANRPTTSFFPAYRGAA